MPKQTVQAIAAGAGFTAIRASTVAHFLKVEENADARAESLEYTLPGDDVTIYKLNIGEAITRIGHGRSGILGKPPGYVGYLQPATGDIMLSVRTASGTGCDARVLESENEL